jgi:hypothetical protein
MPYARLEQEKKEKRLLAPFRSFQFTLLGFFLETITFKMNLSHSTSDLCHNSSNIPALHGPITPENLAEAQRLL